MTDPATSQGRQFVFNGENKQTEVKDANNVTIGKYYYDGEGKRVKKVSPSSNNAGRNNRLRLLER